MTKTEEFLETKDLANRFRKRVELVLDHERERAGHDA